MDLFDGFEKLIDGYRKYGHISHSIRYENLVENSNDEIDKLFEFLELNPDRFSVEKNGLLKLSGRMGDPTGGEKYKNISNESKEKWKTNLGNSIRKIWCKKYLNYIGSQNLELIGYDYDKLNSELNGLPNLSLDLGSDIVKIVYGKIFRTFEFKIMKDKRQGKCKNFFQH